MAYWVLAANLTRKTERAHVVSLREADPGFQRPDHPPRGVQTLEIRSRSTNTESLHRPPL